MVYEVINGGRGQNPTGPNPPDGDAMLAARVEHLDREVAELRSDMKAVRSDLSEIKGKVSMLPGYPGFAVIVTIIISCVGLVIKFLPVAPG